MGWGIEACDGVFEVWIEQFGELLRSGCRRKGMIV